MEAPEEQSVDPKGGRNKVSRGGGGAGTCFNFHSSGGGGSPLDPLPPSARQRHNP